MASDASTRARGERAVLPRWVVVGAVAGALAHAPFILLGRLGFPGVATVGLFLYFLFDPWLSVPVWRGARAGHFGVRDGCLAGVVAGAVSALTVLGSLALRGRGFTDAAATVVYPAFSASCGAVAAWLGVRTRRRDGP